MITSSEVADEELDNFNAHPLPPHRHSLHEITHSMQIATGLFGHEIEPHLLRNGYPQTPSDMNIPITPVMQSIPHLDNFVSMNGSFDHDGDSPFLTMSSAPSSSMDYDMSTMLDLVSPPGYMQDFNDQMSISGKGMVHTPNHIPLHSKDGSARVKGQLEMGSPPQHIPYKMEMGPPPSPSMLRGLQEPEAVIASQQAWPFFQCNPLDKPTVSPPKTANIYLEGLAQTLKNQDTWKAWTAQSQSDGNGVERDLEHGASIVPISLWSREKLVAITQGFLIKALDIHTAGLHGREESRGGSPDSRTGVFLMLPPPEVMECFLRGYLVRQESYYSCIPGGKLDPNELMQQSNSKASTLLVLLMVASGAITTPTVEARYLASGLTEACRISLFDTIEKDIFQARDPLVLRSALLFTTLAVWSGDKWHMDASYPLRERLFK